MNHNNADIEYDPKFDNKFSLSSRTKDSLPVVTVSLRGGKKQMATMITGLTCLWDSRYTKGMINRKKVNIKKDRCGLIKWNIVHPQGCIA